MRLEKLVLNGFKSFADKTTFEFKEPITAIVGPNGCGKSNVVDALKWVLGSQSPKGLRSGQMTDVIFSGCSSRKPSGMAEVALSFSGVTGKGLDNDELEITRRLYKSGDSQYLINGKACRLKDIRELFMDTGVGVSAYSIIEQGQIDQLLHASKTDRRVIFEEAAGISKYKAQKKEAIRKLDRTDQNLLRLADIVAEVQKQLRSIKMQAGKARNYLEYSERLKELRVKYSLAEYDKIITQTNEKNTAVGELRSQYGEVAASVSSADAALSELAANISETEGHISHWDNTLVSSRSKIEQHMERIKFLRERIDELKQRKLDANDDIDRLNSQTSEHRTDLRECERKLRETEDVYGQKNGELEEMQGVITQINHECSEIEATLQDEKSGIIDIVRRTAHLHNEIQSMSTYRERIADQKNRLNGKASEASAQLEDLLTERAQYKSRLDETHSILEELQANLENKRNELERIDASRAEASEMIAGEKEKRSAINSEISVLADMEAKREGLSKSVKAILSQAQDSAERYDYVEGIVADIVTADIQYAGPVEAALEGLTDALVVNSTGRFLADKDTIDKLESRVKVICLDRIAPFNDSKDVSGYPGVIGRASEFVSFDGSYSRLAWQLLGKTIIVENMDTAVELAGEFGAGYKFVTKNGELFDGNACVNVGPVGKTAGLISRKSRLKKLESNLAEVSTAIGRLEDELQQNNQKTAHLEGLCKELRTSIYEANTERVDTEAKIRALDQNIERIKNEQPLITNEIETLEREIEESVQKEYDSKEKLEELETINNERSSRIEELEAQLGEKKEMQEAQSSFLTELRIELGQIAEQRRSLQQRITSLQSQLQHSRMSIERARTDLLGCDEQVRQTERNILSAESAVSELYLAKETAQKNSLKYHDKIGQLRQQRDETEESIREQRSMQSELESQIHQIELELSQLSVRHEDLVQRVAEELEMDIEEAYEGFEQEDTNWDEVREEIAMLRKKIGRLGNVNVDAIEEQQELEERYEFLAGQVEDLNQSKTQLEQLIAKINKESVEKFSETFKDIRKNFQTVFRKLFGGGKADIILEDPDDILECGIEIMAKPPGKETRSISLLSGGEKTMTAMAILFAVFKSKPSPFCILDEVDAALDEANNERFNLIVKEFQEMSQFVVITHSKRTMSIADVLFGITMQTQGISKKISVRFDSPDSESDAAVA
ncbi:Chromosome partition protein Smc [Anaerohalosphaera lusitana]|uniref:Chromosome partition protein Smc n=1 Tax=Anaerohalosphaera lusitana TaxID=1936003 RepID=A0A1U9NMC8_9BACT|nr:chromosome segregation protein SMC [Anaerohalosphaera lusitana]AQT68957.1 Chromosome partition protein Smc [Anaerohalosphaera lusitana]